jgi:hypothetical protein
MDELKVLVAKLKQHLNKKQADITAAGAYTEGIRESLRHIENEITGFEDAVDKQIRNGYTGTPFIKRITLEGLTKDANKIHAAIDRVGAGVAGGR